MNRKEAITKVNTALIEAGVTELRRVAALLLQNVATRGEVKEFLLEHRDSLSVAFDGIIEKLDEILDGWEAKPQPQ